MHMTDSEARREEGLSQRLAQALGDKSNDLVVTELGEVGYHTSRDTVRRYREGLGRRIDAGFCAAVCERYRLSPAWLLLGDTNALSPSDQTAVSEAVRAIWERYPVEFARLLIYVGTADHFESMQAGMHWQEDEDHQKLQRAVGVLYGQVDTEMLKVSPALRSYYQEMLERLGGALGSGVPVTFDPDQRKR
jgi:hypothetical protein